MNPKISEFGLSTIFGMEQTRGNTSRIAGTYGYMSPEYAMQGQYSMKSDIYSFGVLVLEIISGKKNGGIYQMDKTSTPGNLVTYAWRLWKKGSPQELVDLAIGRNYESNEVTRCIHIALLCVQDNPEDRPMLSTIILMLTSNTITLPVPRLPSFIPWSRHELDQCFQRNFLLLYKAGKKRTDAEEFVFAFATILKWIMKQMSLLSILCHVLISFGFASVSAQTCMDNGNFSPNGTYDTNRQLILSSLPSNVTSQEGLFFNGSIGQEPNRVYVTGMCMPGSTSDDCSDCIKSASDDLIQNCPNQTNAFTWPGDPTLCYVRYSNTSFLGSADLDPPAVVTRTGDISPNLTEFKTIWENLVARMIDAASTDKNTPSSTNNHYKADVASLTALENIYALMQCTPDLSSGDCGNCLRQSARDYQSCCGQRPGGVVLRPSCFFRWEFYVYSKAFDNITVSSPPPPLPPVASPPADDQTSTTDNEDSKGISSGVVAAITTVIVVFILLVLGIVLSDSDISTTHSSQYDLKTIESATNKFSRSNKLGEGGFGEVYKVWRLWVHGSPLELVDPAIGRNYQSDEVTRCIHIALLCVQENPEDRPMLSAIILMLTSNTITLPVPRLPSFIPRSRHELDSDGLESSQSTGRSNMHACRQALKLTRRMRYDDATAFLRAVSFSEIQERGYSIRILAVSLCVVTSASNFRRAIVMPNLRPSVTTTAAAITYRESIMKALPHGSSFDPLMTLDKTTHPDEIKLAREAIVKAVTSGSKKFFLGTDSAPHERQRKESSCGCASMHSAPVALSLYAKVFDEAGALDKLEAFTSFNGPDFYGLPRNSSKITLKKGPWKVPEAFSFSFGDIIPMFAGETLQWQPFLE
ncbi:hypothetical protein Bca4012_023330 [Brassica carinata]